MKRLRLASLTLLGCTGLLAEDRSRDEYLINRLGDLSSLTRVTKEPVPLNVQYVDLCEPVTVSEKFNRVGNLSSPTQTTKKPVPLNFQNTDLRELAAVSEQGGGPSTTSEQNGHLALSGNSDPYIHVLVSSEGVASFKANKYPYPEGTIILKQKFANSETKTPDFYTGMLKREKGYNPKAGDWEFFTLTGNAKAITARGRIDSCMDCHGQHPKSDFVMKSSYEWALSGREKPVVPPTEER